MSETSNRCRHYYAPPNDDGCVWCEIGRLRMEIAIARDAQERSELPYRQAVAECQRLRAALTAVIAAADFPYAREIRALATEALCGDTRVATWHCRCGAANTGERCSNCRLTADESDAADRQVNRRLIGRNGRR